MFVAGLTAREIADLTNKNIATIHRHLKNREKYDSDFFDKHMVALEARGPNCITSKWRKRIQEAYDFHLRFGRLPRQTGDTIEDSLALWLARQRRLYEKNALPMAKVVLLEPLPDWNVSPQRKARETNWWNKLSLVIDFLDKEGRLPKYKTYATEEEHVLGVWLHYQHQRRTENKLEPWKLKALDGATSGWHSQW